MTTISPNYAGVNFKATEQVQPKKAAETNAQSKPESKGMSNAMKVGLGLGALAAVALAGMAIKNKNAANSLENLLKEHNTIYKKTSEVSYEMFIEDAKDLIRNFSDGKPGLYHANLISPQDSKQLIEQMAQQQGKTSKNMKIPEKGFLLTIMEGEKNIISQFYDTNSYCENLLDFVEEPWKQGHIYVKKIRVKE